MLFHRSRIFNLALYKFPPYKISKQRKNANPVYEQSFKIPVPGNLAIDSANRLQLAVWDASRLKAHECTGAMSFSLQDIASTASISGWFALLPYHDGRERYQPLHEPPPPPAVTTGSKDKKAGDAASVAGKSTAKGSAAAGAAALQPRSASPPAGEGDDDDETVSLAADGTKKSPKWRIAGGGGGKAALQKQVEELQKQLAAALQSEERHIKEKVRKCLVFLGRLFLYGRSYFDCIGPHFTSCVREPRTARNLHEFCLILPPPWTFSLFHPWQAALEEKLQQMRDRTRSTEALVCFQENAVDETPLLSQMLTEFRCPQF